MRIHWWFPATPPVEAGGYPGMLLAALATRSIMVDGTGQRFTFRLYHDGDSTAADPGTSGDNFTISYGSAQLAVGGRTDDAGLQDGFAGTLDELRIWRTARTDEQILDNLFTRLRGETGDLIAYWPFDPNSTVAGSRCATRDCAATT